MGAGQRALRTLAIVLATSLGEGFTGRSYEDDPGDGRHCRENASDRYVDHQT